MNKFIRAFLVCVFSVVLVFSLVLKADAASGDIGEKVTINVYNWGEYIANGTDGSPDVNALFTEKTGIEVNYTTFESNESLYSKLAGGGADYDIIIPSDYMISKMISENMLAPLDFAKIPNFKYIDEEFRKPDYDPTNHYSVPYTWGVVGLFYNTDYIDEVTSWSALWNEEYEGKILMFDNPRDSMAIAEFYLGYSINTTDESELLAAADLLKQQKPLVQAYVMDQVFGKMENAEAWIAPYYSGDAAILVEESDNIEFVIPEEGTNYFVDAICIPATSNKQDAAHEYINFLCDPEIAGANMDYVGYSTPISAAKEYLDPEVVADELRYPSYETLEKTEVFINLPSETSMLIDQLWAEIKMGGPGEGILLVAVIFGFAAIYAAVVIYKSRKRKKQE